MSGFSPATCRGFPQRHVAGDTFPQRHVAGEYSLGKLLLNDETRPTIDHIASIYNWMLNGRSEALTDGRGYTVSSTILHDLIEATRRRVRLSDFDGELCQKCKEHTLLEKLYEKDIEVLFLVDTIEVAVTNLKEYKEKNFVDISKEDLKISVVIGFQSPSGSSKGKLPNSSPDDLKLLRVSLRESSIKAMYFL
ncbi:heat shock protein 90-6, mitochondrial [Tanacetum coccineum]|uniref:Heat shock protein 90-6, mitochondrial n=1 Tax=Tanacetum coccineum TaxID=301880 RepID=A0ABQ5H910_9ASTR